jgi:hypothetical protein
VLLTPCHVAQRHWIVHGCLTAALPLLSLPSQVQRQPVGYYSYQQHLHRVGGAMALPVIAFAVQWLLVLLLGFVESRDSKKLKSLEAAKRSMIKELKVSCSVACSPSLQLQLRHCACRSRAHRACSVSCACRACLQEQQQKRLALAHNRHKPSKWRWRSCSLTMSCVHSFVFPAAGHDTL